MGRPLIVAFSLALAFAAPASAIDMEDVFRMVDASVDEEVILKAIDADGEALDLYPEDLIALSDMGSSDWFLKELIDRSRDRRSEVYREQTYRVIEPSYSYVSIGLVYDPFDYYFACWPYYYAYVSPFRFSWNWWYYGGPYHSVWCYPWSYRTVYYHDAWGPRNIWRRGYHNERYHVPTYASPKEERQRVLYHRDARPALVSADGRKVDGGTRPVRDDKPIRPSYESRRPVREDGNRPANVWGRPERRSDRPSSPSVRPERRADRPSSPAVRPERRSDRPSSPSVRPERQTQRGNEAPSRSVSPAPSRPSSRGSAPAPSRSSSGSGNRGGSTSAPRSSRAARPAR